MFGPVKNVVFDFDGTLVETMARVTEGLGAAIEHVSGRKIPDEELVATFGPSPQAVLEHWVGKEKTPAALDFWLEFEKTSGPDSMKAFPDVEEMLKNLHDLKINIAVFTGRDRASTLKILQARSWLNVYFSEEHLACGDDGHAAKPSPEGLQKILERFAWQPHETLMVGDHPHDVISGREAHCKTGAALWDMTQVTGATHRARFKKTWERWEQIPCDVRLQGPLSLLEWLKMPR